MIILKTASVGSNVTRSHKKECILTGLLQNTGLLTTRD